MKMIHLNPVDKAGMTAEEIKLLASEAVLVTAIIVAARDYDKLMDDLFSTFTTEETEDFLVHLNLSIGTNKIVVSQVFMDGEELELYEVSRP